MPRGGIQEGRQAVREGGSASLESYLYAAYLLLFRGSGYKVHFGRTITAGWDWAYMGEKGRGRAECVTYSMSVLEEWKYVC